MAEAMYDVKKCRSICCHKSLSDERLVSQSPFGVVVVVAANVVCCLIVVGVFFACWRGCDVTNTTLALPTEAGTLDLLLAVPHFLCP